MPVTKITLSTAMRARDVSRPRAEHLTEAAEPAETVTRRPEPAPPKPAPPAPRPTRAESEQPLPPPRRRRRRGR